MQTVIACVEHSIFCGKDMGLTIHIHPANANRLLPAPVELTWAERTVLLATMSWKSSYAGVSNYRFVEAQRTCGITLPEWENAKQSLIARKLLNKAGAVTVDGRNAIPDRSMGGNLPKRQEQLTCDTASA
jgi:hypothetical protein